MSIYVIRFGLMEPLFIITIVIVPGVLPVTNKDSNCRGMGEYAVIQTIRIGNINKIPVTYVASRIAVRSYPIFLRDGGTVAPSNMAFIMGTVTFYTNGAFRVN